MNLEPVRVVDSVTCPLELPESIGGCAAERLQACIDEERNPLLLSRELQASVAAWPPVAEALCRFPSMSTGLKDRIRDRIAALPSKSQGAI